MLINLLIISITVFINVDNQIYDINSSSITYYARKVAKSYHGFQQALVVVMKNLNFKTLF